MRNLPIVSFLSGENEFLICFIASLDELVVHGLFAIRDTIQQDKTITTENVSIAFVGADAKFTVITGSALQIYIDLMGEGNAPPNPAAPVEQDVAMSS
jgi:20S proteasome subunit alpha 6